MKYYRLRFEGHVVFKGVDRPADISLHDVAAMLSNYRTSIGVWSGDSQLEEITKSEFVEEIVEMYGEPLDYFDDTVTTANEKHRDTKNSSES